MVTKSQTEADYGGVRHIADGISKRTFGQSSPAKGRPAQPEDLVGVGYGATVESAQKGFGSLDCCELDKAISLTSLRRPVANDFSGDRLTQCCGQTGTPGGFSISQVHTGALVVP